MSAAPIPLRPPREIPPPPEHLSEGMRSWWSEVVGRYVLEPHHFKLLRQAAECWDLAQGAREVLEAEGTTYFDRFGQPKPRPEEQVWRGNVTLFARLCRELQLEPPADEPRPPRMY